MKRSLRLGAPFCLLVPLCLSCSPTVHLADASFSNQNGGGVYEFAKAIWDSVAEIDHLTPSMTSSQPPEETPYPDSYVREFPERECCDFGNVPLPDTVRVELATSFKCRPSSGLRSYGTEEKVLPSMSFLGSEVVYGMFVFLVDDLGWGRTAMLMSDLSSIYLSFSPGSSGNGFLGNYDSERDLGGKGIALIEDTSWHARFETVGSAVMYPSLASLYLGKTSIRNWDLVTMGIDPIPGDRPGPTGDLPMIPDVELQFLFDAIQPRHGESEPTRFFPYIDRATALDVSHVEQDPVEVGATIDLKAIRDAVK